MGVRETGGLRQRAWAGGSGWRHAVRKERRQRRWRTFLLTPPAAPAATASPPAAILFFEKPAAPPPSPAAVGHGCLGALPRQLPGWCRCSKEAGVSDAGEADGLMSQPAGVLIQYSMPRPPA